jgi:threonine synthase
MKFSYVCNDCGREYRTDDIMYQCPHCSKENDGTHFPKGNLRVIYDKQDLERLKEKEHVTCYDFFPYEIPNHDAYPVGNTPLARPVRLNRESGLKNTYCKLDSALPSGSFKDRASQLIVGQALAHGQTRIALASTGNAGAAMSCAGAAYGLEIVLFVPKTAPINKLMQSVLYNATVVPVDGTYDDAFERSIEYTEAFGGINRNTAYNPMTIEGKKSVSIELFEQLGRKAPDAVYVAVGDGCIYAGVCKGFYDLLQAGLISKMPKVICAQSTGSNAISQAFLTSRKVPMENPTTRADSISVGLPANGSMAVDYIRETEAWATEVTDQEILDAQLQLTSKAGIFVEPAAACAWAAYAKDLDKIKKELGEDACVVVLLTGTGFKDMAAFDGRVSIPPAIENSKAAVLRRFER